MVAWGGRSFVGVPGCGQRGGLARARPESDSIDCLATVLPPTKLERRQLAGGGGCGLPPPCIAAGMFLFNSEDGHECPKQLILKINEKI